MSQADATSSTFIVDPDDDATYNSKTFSVRFPSPELIEVREAIAAFRAVEMTDAAGPLEHAMDLAILKFLTRPPLRMLDVLEAIEVRLSRATTVGSPRTPKTCHPGSTPSSAR